MASRPVELAPGVLRIPLLGDYINAFAFIEPDGSITLVDCGLKRAPARIVKALASIGKHPRDVQRILLTHAHFDHAGGAAAMLDRSAAEGVIAHGDDADYLAAGSPAPTDTSTTSGRLFARRSRGFDPVPVSKVVGDGELLDVAGGLRIHHTPGHTPGHVSLLHEPTATLITGDAIFNMNGRRAWPFAAFCTSAAQNQRSAAVFADLEYQVAAFTHGPELRDRAREQIRAFLSKSESSAAGESTARGSLGHP